MSPIEPRLPPEQLSPDLPIHDDREPIRRTVLDFWRWGFSDLMPNTSRSILAEYLVAIALGVEGETKQEWGAYDLELTDGRSVEVKTTARLQAWFQERPSPLQVKIKPTLAWSEATGKYASKADYNADIYIIACFMPETHREADLLDVSQWAFYTLTRARLIEILDGSETLTVKRLEQNGERSVSHSELAHAVKSL